MGRHQKLNAEYYSHKANLRNEKRVKTLRGKLGHIGYSIYNMLREHICDAPFFHLQFDAETLEDIANDLTAEIDQVTEVADYCVKRKLFQQVQKDGATYLTDHELIRSLSDLLSKRKQDAEQMIEMFSAPEKPFSESETPISAPEIPISGDGNTQIELNGIEKNTLSSGTSKNSDHGKKDSSQEAKNLHGKTGEAGTSWQKAKQNDSGNTTKLIPTVDDHIKRFKETHTLIEQAQRALKMRAETYTVDHVHRLLEAFAPKFVMLPVEQTWQKFQYKFGDYINDERRLPLTPMEEVDGKKKKNIADFI